MLALVSVVLLRAGTGVPLPALPASTAQPAPLLEAPMLPGLAPRPAAAALGLPLPDWSQTPAAELKAASSDDFAARLGAAVPAASPLAPAPPQASADALVAQILPYYRPGVGVDAQTGYPFDRWSRKDGGARYTQPTAIGQRLELLGHVLAGDVQGLAETERLRARAEARNLLARMLADQKKLGHLGLMPWIRLRNGSAASGAEYGFIDNANLSASVMAFCGSLLRAGGDARLRRLAGAFLERQAPGYAALYDAKVGLFWGSTRAKGRPDGYHIDRFFSEHRAKTAAVAAYFGRAQPELENGFLGLKAVYREFEFQDGSRRRVGAPWDGALFQVSWNVPYESAFYAQLPFVARVNSDFLEAAVDDARRAGRTGFLSASAVPFGQGYDGKVGIAALKERPEPVSARAESIYALAPYMATHPQNVLSWLTIYGGGGAPYGPYDAKSDGRWLERYYAVDQGSLILGLIARQNVSWRAFLEAEGLAEPLLRLYRSHPESPSQSGP